MQTLILAGGLGTRLQPLLGQTPKALAPVAGRPFLEHLLRLLKQQGLIDMVLCLGHEAGAIQSHFGDGARWGVHITYAVEPEPLGTGGAVRYALTGGHADADFLVLNGDTYAVLDYAGLLAFHRQQQALATLALVPMADTQDYGTVQLGSAGRIVAFREKAGKQEGGLVSAGVYAFHLAILAHIPTGRPVSLEKEVFPALARAGLAIYGYVTDGTFYDIGTPERYREFERQVEEGRIP